MPGDREREAEAFADLRDWVIQPQRNWLRSLGLQPDEWADAISDLDTAVLEERQRSRLLREGLEETHEAQAWLEQGGLDVASTWLERQRGRGRLPPHGGGELEAALLAQRWADLHRALESLGPPSRRLARWEHGEQELTWWGNTVVLIHPAKARARHRLDLWLQLLLAAAADQQPQAGVLVARGDKGFGTQLRLAAPAAPAARDEFERLLALREAWRSRCWPVPPDTGWTYLERGRDEAISSWEGGAMARGERQDPVQALCFGADLPGVLLIDADFGERTSELLGPLRERLG